MRMRFSPRRSLLGASTLLLFASSLALLTPGDASAVGRRGAYVIYRYYSDASHTTLVGQCHINWHCIPNYGGCSGTPSDYYTVNIVSYC